MTVPLVSAVIPTFGRPVLLVRAVRTVLAQTCADLELIVVIDGDDPATRDALTAIDDSRLRIVAHPAKRGPGAARDTGAAAARAPWVAFLDDDDEWLPAKLAHQLALADGATDVMVSSQSFVTTPRGRFVRPITPYDGRRPIDEWLFDRTTWWKGGMSFLQTSSLMLPRALFERLRFGNGTQHEDWELVIRAAKQLDLRLLTVAEPLVIHYIDDTRPTLSQQRTWRHSLAWADTVRPLLTPRAYSGFLLNEIGRAAAEAGSYRALLPLLRRAFHLGRPTARQLFRYLLGWATPTTLRQRLRLATQGLARR